MLYTANDYGDMWQFGIDEKGEYRHAPRREQAITWRSTRRCGTGGIVYFRNLELKPLNDTYKFGTNIILHLLTRWEDKLRNVPTGL